MKHLAGWGALVGAVSGYFAPVKPVPQGGLLTVSQETIAEKVIHAAEGAVVGGLVGWLVGKKR
jgi:uncharacterized protein YqgC (DUF456 family)